MAAGPAAIPRVVATPNDARKAPMRVRILIAISPHGYMRSIKRAVKHVTGNVTYMVHIKAIDATPYSIKYDETLSLKIGSVRLLESPSPPVR